ncbi:TlpA family protein disulfide reductase [Rheinheimera maricola]|uniref:TlpA family protein disulfide reductase n=1 Tax=Rheinheimera maricola TaxID=2793282 RepID=A0ABS7X7C0_9GAMM|nr:TlpA disulfide reductase family protein [Rheinheimera maricola]MBZ9610502.1 TlpA family protein disulfide reductase [Rheinheimera maricola]
MLSISLGPLSLPTAVLVLLLSVACGLFVARIVARRSSNSATDPLLLVLLGALLFGRLIFVVRFADSYASFWQMLDFRDRGVDIAATVLAALVLLMLQFKRHPTIKRAMAAGAISTALSFSLGSAWLHAQQQQQVLADISLETLSGYSAALPQLAQGKPVVMNIWASWCPPCHREMPVLLKAQQQYADISIIMVNLQENRATVKQYLRQHQLAFNNVLLDYRGDVASYYGAQGVPATLFFAADGKLSAAHFGELSNAVLLQGIAKAAK